MKKYGIIVFVLVMVFIMSTGVLAAERPKYSIGAGTPNFGWVQYNESGQITGYKGLNLRVGFSSKHYFSPGVKMNQFNHFWGWGTVSVIVPYANVGSEYAIRINDHNYFTIGGEAGLRLTKPYWGIAGSFVF